MTVAGGWILVPLALLVLCSGMGLAVQAAVRTPIARAFLPGLGLALMIVLGGILTLEPLTARLTVPVCVAVAVAGFVVGKPWRNRTVPWAALACAGLAGALAAAPALLSGQASVLGFGRLDDSSIWLGITEHLMSHGRGDVTGVPLSSYKVNLTQWMGHGYPVGSFIPLGVSARVTGQVLVNAYQPVITVFVAITALSMYGLARTVLKSPWLAAVCGVAAVQASLFSGYVGWGSIKEICVAALLVTLCGQRQLAMAALAAGATLCTYGIAGAVLIGPALLVVVMTAARAVTIRQVTIGACTLLVAASPALAVLHQDATQVLHGAPSAQTELGELRQPLERLQGAGLWPDGDFRDRADHHGVAVVLAVIGLLLAVAGLAVAVRRREPGVPALLAVAVIGGGVAIARGSPWIDGKAMAITSMLFLGAGSVAVAAGLERTRVRPFAALVGLVLAGGISASAWAVFQDAAVAPRRTLAEQRDIGRALAGHGPTLLLSYEGLANRYLFRPAVVNDARGPSVRAVADRIGSTTSPEPLEMDNLAPSVFADYNAILRRRTPVGSRAPSDFAPYVTTRSYEAFVRVPGAPAPLADLPLFGTDSLASSVSLPAAAPTCDAVQRLARTPGARQLVGAVRENPVLVDPSSGTVPKGWGTVGGLQATRTGTARFDVTLPAAGDWRVWLQGETLGGLTVSVDGHEVGAYRHELTAVGSWLQFGARALPAGPHHIALAYDRGAFWRAGRGNPDDQPSFGYMAFSRDMPDTLTRLPVSRAVELCNGQTYDWLEAIA